MTSLSCLVASRLLAKTMEITGSCPTYHPAGSDTLVLHIMITIFFMAGKIVESQIQEYIFKGPALSHLLMSH